jgi:hypothetical protein
MSKGRCEPARRLCSLPALAGLLMLVAVVTGRETAAQVAPPLTGGIAILAWRGPPAAATSLERYHQLAEAGFTHALTPFPSADAAGTALEVAAAAGIRLVLGCPELKVDPERVTARFRGHPGLAGYDLGDEPSPAAFSELATLARRLATADPDAIRYVNLLPTYATPGQLGGSYASYVDRFLDEVPIPILSFDHYPITTDGMREDFFENLEIATRAAADHGLPLWAFVLSVAHSPYPVPTAEHLRFQAFCNLAYGAKCIQYFTYWTPFPGTWDFHQGPIETDGTVTPTYPLVQSLNRRIAELGPIFADATPTRIGHLGNPLPRGTRPYEPVDGGPTIRVDSGRILVSLLRGTQLDYCVVVNSNLEQPAAGVWTAGDGRDHADLTTPAVPVAATGERSFTIPPAELRIWGWRRVDRDDAKNP